MLPRVQASAVFPWVGFAVRLGAAAIWLVAGIAKLADLTSFQQEVASYDVAPSALVEPIAYALPFLEVALGVYLLIGLLVRPAALLSTVLMLLFIGVQAPGMGARPLDRVRLLRGSE